MAEAKVFLKVEPRWGRQGWNRDRLEGMSVTGITKTRPRNFKGVVVELKLRIPDGAFKPLRPSVTIDVPEEALTYEPEITVEMPDDDAD